MKPWKPLCHKPWARGGSTSPRVLSEPRHAPSWHRVEMPHVTYLCRYSSQYCPEQCSSPTTPGVPALSLSLSLSLRCACQTLTPRGGVGPGATTRPTVVRARPHHRLSDHLPISVISSHASRGSPTPAGDAHPRKMIRLNVRFSDTRTRTTSSIGTCSNVRRAQRRRPWRRALWPRGQRTAEERRRG